MVQKKNKGGSPKKVKPQELVPVSLEPSPQPVLAVVKKVAPEIQQRGEQLPANVGVNMQALLERAMEKNMPLDYMERLIGLLEKQRAQWARERFFSDLAEAQAEFPIVSKLHEARDPDKGTAEEKKEGGKLLYVYAPFEDIWKEIEPIASRHGFSTTTKAKPSKHADLGIPMMAATCFVHHKDGHTEETTIEVPIGEGTRLMSGMQKYMAARSFARRYAYIDALGIAMKGEDVDSPENEKETPLAAPQPTGGAKVEENGKLKTTPASAPAPEKKDDAKELKALQAEVQDTFTEMAKVLDEKDVKEIPESDIENYSVKDGKALIRIFSRKELSEARKKIKDSGDNVDLLRAWLVAAKVDLNNRKLDRELGPEAGRGN
jgi:hypothetical protein